MSLHELLLAALACWYVSIVLTATDGPGEVLKKLRDLSYMGMLRCFICTALWVAGGIVLLLGYTPFEALAIAGAAGLLHGISNWRFA